MVTRRCIVRPLCAVRQRLRWKIVVPYALLSLVVAFVGTNVVARTVTASLSDRFANQLVESARVFEDAVVRQERRHLESVRAVAFTSGVGEATAAGDFEALSRLVLPIAANNGAERIDIVDAAGQSLFVATLVDGVPVGTDGRGADDSAVRLEPIARALASEPSAASDKFAGIADVAGEPAILTAGPIRVDGRVVGAVAVSTSLSTFLAAAKDEVLAQVTVYDSSLRPLASTFPTDAAEAETATQLAMASSTADGDRQRVTVFGREYEELFGTTQIRGVSVGRYAVGLSTDFVAAAQDDTRLRMILLFAGLTVAVLLIGLVVARYLTAPLLRLVNAAVALGQGDLTTRAPVSTMDEVGTLSIRFNEMAERLERQHRDTIAALVSAIDARDPYTRGHSVRVGELAVELGRELYLPAGDLYHLRIGGFLHDIGKIGIRDAVLLKPGELTPGERAIIEEHPQIGINILSSIGLPEQAMSIVGQHHERLDGSGYPFSLTADQLTLFPRIAAVSDVYDALVTDRPYRAGLEPERALYILRREAFAGLLDPDVVDAMVRAADRWELRRHADVSLSGVVLPTLADGVSRVQDLRTRLQRTGDGQSRLA